MKKLILVATAKICRGGCWYNWVAELAFRVPQLQRRFRPQQLQRLSRRFDAHPMNPYLARVAVFSLLSFFLAMPVSAQTAQPDSIGFTDKTLTLEEGTTKAVTIEGYKLQSETTIKVIVAEDGRGQAILFGSPDSSTYLELVLPKGNSSHTITVKSPQDRVYQPDQNYTIRLSGARKFQDCNGCPKMITIPPGRFQMGSPEGEVGGTKVERPVHLVTIDYPFAVGVHEVTFAEWDYCVQQGGCDGYSPKSRTEINVEWGRGNRPVINVSWEDAQAYLSWLSEETGKPYRLLTEAEWEYAARAGTTTPYHFGNAITPADANYVDSRFARTTPVGTYKPNNFGLHDVHGNVSEWVEDCRHGSYKDAPADGSAWITPPGNCGLRVVRGGHWNSLPSDLRSAVRFSNLVNARSYNFGFRVALTLTP